jgi:hypothetical protein
MRIKKYLDYLIILLFVLAGNISSVFLYDVLVLDDMSFYQEALNNSWPFWPEGKRPVLNPISSFIFQIQLFELLTISPKLARLAILILQMIPLSFAIYYLSRNILNLNRPVSIFNSTIPNILIHESLIPYFVNGSYVVVGFLFYIVSLCFLINLNKPRKSPLLWSISSILLIYFSILTMEQSIFLYPGFFVFSVFLLFNKKNTLYKIAHLILASLLFIIKFLYTILNPRATHSDSFLPITEIVNRSIQSIGVMSPYPLLFNKFFNSIDHFLSEALIIFAILFFSITIISSNPIKHKGLNEKILLLIFLFSSFLFSILPFLIISPFNASRYYYIPAFFFNLIIGFIAFNNIKNKKYVNIIFIILIVIIIPVSIYGRNVSVSRTIGIQDLHYKYLKINLDEKLFDRKNPYQVILLGDISADTGGYYIWSTGYLRFLFKNNYVSGLVGKEIAFSNPFSNNKNYCWIMTGISLKEPIFIYRASPSNKKIQQLSYALNWMDTYNNQSNIKGCSYKQKIEYKQNSWELVKLDNNTGQVIQSWNGSGINDYKKLIEKLKIPIDNIAWN